MGGDRNSGDRSARSLSLTTGGLTLLGVLLSIGVTVAAAIEAHWWIRALIGVGVTALLVVGFKAGTASGRGPIARLANWVIGEPERPPGAGDG